MNVGVTLGLNEMRLDGMGWGRIEEGRLEEEQ
jgi:hypothetical protein